MSTYSHLTAIKTEPVKNLKQPVIKKKRKPGYRIESASGVIKRNSIHTWYGNKLYPELAD